MATPYGGGDGTGDASPPQYQPPTYGAPAPGVQQQSSSTVMYGAQQHQPVLMQQTTRHPSVYENYKFGQARALGIVQIIVGVLAFVFHIVAIVVDATAQYSGAGIPCGILFSITGCIAVASASSKQHCLVVATMVMSIISAVFAWWLFIGGAIGLGIDNNCEYYDDYYYYYDYYRDDCKEGHKLAIDAILMVLGLIQIVAPVWQAVLCCAVACCGQRTASLGAVLYTGAAGGQAQQQIIVTTNTAAAQPGVTYYGHAAAPQYPTTAQAFMYPMQQTNIGATQQMQPPYAVGIQSQPVQQQPQPQQPQASGSSGMPAVSTEPLPLKQ